MEQVHILLLRPVSGAPSPLDQSVGVKLAAAKGPACSKVILHEEPFRQGDLADLEKKLALWRGKVSGVIGATNVAESTRLGELAEQRNLLCFVANNNPSVWQARKHVFHIGLPSAQTAAAVAGLLAKAKRQRVFLTHDQTEFQRRVASSMEAALRDNGIEVISRAAFADGEAAVLKEWRPDLIYVIFSSEPKALALAQRIREQSSDTPLLFGRSLLRESFLASIGELAGETWFVDMFRRNDTQNETQRRFMLVLSDAGIDIPTANHAFGWDAVSFCAVALIAAEGDPLRAINYLESGLALEGVTGICSFSKDNHNGRSGIGPTILTRWHHGRLEEL